MADDKKNIPEVDVPTEAVVPTVETPAVTEPPASEPVLTDQEAVTLEHEGLAALFEMDEAVPDPGEQTIFIEPEEPDLSEQSKAEKEQPPTPNKDAPIPEHSGKAVDFAAVHEKTEKTPKEKPGKQKTAEKDNAAKPGKSRPSKEAKDRQPSKPRDKKSQSEPTVEDPAPVKEETPAEPAATRDASRGEKEEIVYLTLSELHPFKNHPFGVRDDAEMQGLVESVKASGVNQPALVRPREDGGYEIIAGHRRQRASELAGFANMPCIVRNMTDDEAILAMTDDNLRHREQILPTEKAQSLKMQVEAIKHQGSRPGEDAQDAGKRSTQVVGDRNGMN